ncbi:hypothetical protein D3C86_1918230 [compost metagenome]
MGTNVEYTGVVKRVKKILYTRIFISPEFTGNNFLNGPGFPGHCRNKLPGFVLMGKEQALKFFMGLVFFCCLVNPCLNGKSIDQRLAFNKIRPAGYVRPVTTVGNQAVK